MSQKIVDDDWNMIVERLGGSGELDRSAKETGALLRARKVKDGQSLLRLCLAYGPGDKSLRVGAAWAEAANVASLSDVALLKRLKKCSAWLTGLLGKAFESQKTPELLVRPIRLVDGSIIQKKGNAKGVWRIHSVYNLQEKRFDFFELSDEKTGERFDMAPVQPGEIRIGDRAYMQADRIGKVLAAGGDILVRAGWNHGR